MTTNLTCRKQPLQRHGKGKGKVNVDCIAPRREHTSKALRYGAFSRDLTVLPAHPAFIR